MKLKLDGADAQPRFDGAFVDGLHLSMLAPEEADAALSEEVRWTQVAHKRYAESRHDRIATAAYYVSEARGFEPGHQAEDWLIAQSRIDALDVGIS
jgi:Protein of unknown function (DUF2934)